MQKVLPFEVLLLEGQDGQTWKYHVCDCAPCHLLNMDGQIDLLCNGSYQSTMYHVMRAIFKSHYYVDL